MDDGGAGVPVGPGIGRRCAWCSAEAPHDATHCPACGAALAQRESIADLVIPGVTTVDPALQAYEAEPHRIGVRNSPAQGMAGPVIIAAAAGPVGLAAIGGLAAVAAAEYIGASRGEHAGSVDPGSVGRPSEAVLMAVERLEREERGGSPDVREENDRAAGRATAGGEPG
ncbi:MAG TPA: hypothetical protein VIV06_12195 [Candidatus Limnocylindrales bacterium]